MNDTISVATPANKSVKIAKQSHKGNRMRIESLQSLYDWSGRVYVIAVVVGAAASFGLWQLGKQLSAIQASQIVTLEKSAEELRRGNLDLEKQIATAHNEAASANERAAEIMQVTAWRSIAPEEAKRLTAALRQMPNCRVRVFWIGNDPESVWLADQFVRLFVSAGCSPVGGGALIYFKTLVWGIRIDGSSTPDVVAMRAAFRSSGILVPDDPIPSDTDMRSTGGEDAPVNILIGSKRPPPFPATP